MKVDIYIYRERERKRELFSMILFGRQYLANDDEISRFFGGKVLESAPEQDEKKRNRRGERMGRS